MAVRHESETQAVAAKSTQTFFPKRVRFMIVSKYSIHFNGCQRRVRKKKTLLNGEPRDSSRAVYRKSSAITVFWSRRNNVRRTSVGAETGPGSSTRALECTVIFSGVSVAMAT